MKNSLQHKAACSILGPVLLRIKFFGVERHKGDVNITLAVLDHLNGLSSLDGRDRVSTNLDDQVVDILDLLTLEDSIFRYSPRSGIPALESILGARE